MLSTFEIVSRKIFKQINGKMIRVTVKSFTKDRQLNIGALLGNGSFVNVSVLH